MLTKEERDKIAERVLSFNEDYLCYADIYECLFGERPRYSALSEEYDKAITSRLIDLCDTSNMIELPVDKDGEVIHAGDVVYTSDGEEHKMAGYIMRKNTTEIILSVNSEGTYITTSANKLTHKRPVTIASVRKQLKHVLDKGEMTSWSMAKLFDIAEQLEMLSDSDD